jgi:hypothetical protein
MKAKYKRKLRKGTRVVTRLIERTGIPSGYSNSIAWFAERMVLAGLCLMAVSFAAGSLFVLKLSEPLGESQLYGAVSDRARLAEEGVVVFSQQVIDTVSPVFARFVKENHTEEDLVAAQIAERKEKLKVYLESKKSPFAKDDGALNAFAQSKNMKMMVAISFVESTFGKNCYYYNCSGIGGTPPNLRKYNSYEDWIYDFDKLLEDRYKDVPAEKFVGIYVQPGSPNWIFGVKQVLADFEQRGIN